MKIIKKILLGLVSIFAITGLGLFTFVYSLTYHPSDLEEQKVSCKENPPTLSPGQSLKILNWNVQFMAGKKYVFFFDVPNPDLVLLQEVDDGAKRTDNQDQLAELLKLLPEDYKCSASAFYWKNSYLPHPRVKGSTGMKVSTISKYKIESAVRHALPLIPADPITKQFGLKRAILETKLSISNSKY